MAAERLQKVLAAAGVASRRKAEEVIAAGRVQVNGRVVTEPGTKADPTRDRILVDGRPLRAAAPPTYLLFHKPGGVITTLSDPEGRECLTDFLPHYVPRVFPVGRLDWDVQGVLLLTNDGELANRLSHPRHEILKVYRVKVQGLPGKESLEALASGVEIAESDAPDAPMVRTAPAHGVSVLSERAGKTWVRLVIHEGKNRQVKRMFDAVGLTVLKLRRDEFAGLTPAGIPIGRLRALDPSEIDELFRLAGLPRRRAGSESWTPRRTMRGGPHGPFGGRRRRSGDKSSSRSRSGRGKRS